MRIYEAGVESPTSQHKEGFRICFCHSRWPGDLGDQPRGIGSEPYD